MSSSTAASSGCSSLLHDGSCAEASATSASRRSTHFGTSSTSQCTPYFAGLALAAPRFVEDRRDFPNTCAAVFSFPRARPPGRPTHGSNSAGGVSRTSGGGLPSCAPAAASPSQRAALARTPMHHSGTGPDAGSSRAWLLAWGHGSTFNVYWSRAHSHGGLLFQNQHQCPESVLRHIRH